jgi:hypothetical protein
MSILLCSSAVRHVARSFAGAAHAGHAAARSDRFFLCGSIAWNLARQVVRQASGRDHRRERVAADGSRFVLKRKWASNGRPWAISGSGRCPVETNGGPLCSVVEGGPIGCSFELTCYATNSIVSCAMRLACPTWRSPRAFVTSEVNAEVDYESIMQSKGVCASRCRSSTFDYEFTDHEEPSRAAPAESARIQACAMRRRCRS